MTGPCQLDFTCGLRQVLTRYPRCPCCGADVHLAESWTVATTCQQRDRTPAHCNSPLCAWVGAVSEVAWVEGPAVGA